MTEASALQCTARQVRLAFFAELHFASSVEYVWTGVGPIDWNGHTWLGMGNLGQIGVVTEDSQLNAQTFSLTLSGIDRTLLSEALTEVRAGQPVKLSLAFFNEDGSIIEDPILVFAGRMDQPTITESADTASITIAVENRLADLQRRVERRFTDRDQKLSYPDDNGFRFISWMMDWNGAWGTTSK